MGISQNILKQGSNNNCI